MFAPKLLVNQLKLKSECLIQLAAKASICHKSELPDKKVYQWPYETTSWSFYNFFLDPLTERKFNENSKIVQIEGNLENGKEEFAKRLADELGMKYFPPVDLESYYINDLGYDYRALNPLLPERLRLCDWEMFHENPTRHSVIHMQFFLFKLRVFQYIKACTHLFNTGQGVIMTRSAFTERVFVDAMHNIGWLPLGYTDAEGTRFYDWKYRYIFIRNLVLGELKRPHLTIYLDTPVEKCMERIKNSPSPMIRESKALVPGFLEHIDRAYRELVLPRQANHSHLLEYHYTGKFTEPELFDVIEDISKLDFNYDPHDTRFEDWDDDEYFWYAKWRGYFTTSQCMQPFEYLVQPWHDIAGMGDSVTFTELNLRTSLFEAHVTPFGKYQVAETDLRVSNLLTFLTGYLNFGKRQERHLRTDFT